MKSPDVIGRALLGLLRTNIATAQLSDMRLAAADSHTFNDALSPAIAHDETCYVRKVVAQANVSL
jgi:hypothetical protein